MKKETPLSEKESIEYPGEGKIFYKKDVKEAVERLKKIGAKKGAVYYDDIDKIFGEELTK